MRVDVAFLLHPESLVEVVDSVSVRLKGYRAVQIPLHQQSPVIRPVAPKITQTVNTLIVAKPTAIPAGCVVRWT